VFEQPDDRLTGGLVAMDDSHHQNAAARSGRERRGTGAREDPVMTDPPGRRRVSIPAVLAALVGLGLGAVAISRLNLHVVVRALVGVHFGWLAAAAALMVVSLLMRALSWLVVLRAALPGGRVPAPVVVRATMIGVMVSAVLPGRLGEAARAMVVARRAGAVSVVVGTILSQTLLNLVALVALGAAVITSTGVLGAPVGALLAIGAPVALVGLTVMAPAALRRAGRHGPPRLRRATVRLALELERARGGLRVFRHLRDGVAATFAQLAAWALQVLSAYLVLHALDLQGTAGLAGAAAILVAVNVTAVVPVTPSNVGVFQAACVAVLASFGVSGGRALAYGVLLQAVEVLTALGLGLPALAAEGMSWSDVRRGSAVVNE
jgi:phosphatidyl-myo-inositol alpha-mannosyltransferase